MEEPEAGQGALLCPEILSGVIHLHLHPVITIHALPVATSDKEPVAQRHHPAVLMECVQQLHLHGAEVCWDTTGDMDPVGTVPAACFWQGLRAPEPPLALSSTLMLFVQELLGGCGVQML